MFNLSDEQIEFIEADIQARGIKSLGLQVDLTDHICCLIENENAENESFEQIYEKVISLFGSDGLDKIQKETDQLLTFKYYYIMNTTMKISGYVSAAMILCGTLFKFFHWPGANILMVLGMVLLIILFLPIMFILKFKSEQESNRSLTLSIMGGGAAVFIATGILFKFMHWPGATALQYSGFALLLLVYLPIYLFNSKNQASNKINAISTVVLIAAGVSLLFSANNSSISSTNLERFFEINESLERTNFQMENENKLLYEVVCKTISNDTLIDYASLTDIHSKTAKLINSIKDTKLQLIAYSEKVNVAEASKLKMKNLHDVGNYDFPTRFLFNKENPRILVIKTELQKYVNQVKSTYPEINVTLNIDDTPGTDETPLSWELKNFDHAPLSLVLHQLAQLELDIKITESAIYRSFISQKAK